MSPRPAPLVIGIIGGIGSGKSAVARGLSTYFRVLMIDADKIGHEALLCPAIQNKLQERFGTDIFGPGRQIDRQRLARQVFGSDPSQTQGLQDLNRIVHPEIRARMLEQIRQASEDTDVIVLDAAVMLEAGWDGQCDAIVFVDAPWEARLERVRSRGWNEEELRRREACQLPLAEKRRRADVVIDNSGSLEHSVNQLVQFVTEFSMRQSS